MTATEFVSRQEAALILNIPLDAIDHLIATGLLSRYRIRDRYVRVPRAEVDELATLDREFLLHA